MIRHILDIKQWIDLSMICNTLLVINLVYLNMISDKLSFKFITKVGLDGNNCLFMFKIMVTLVERYHKLIFDYYLEHNLDQELKHDIFNDVSANLDRFIVGLNSEENTEREIRLYICTQIDTLKKI